MTARIRPTTTRTTHIAAACLDCPWTCATPNALGLAALHHDRHHHTVTTNIDRTVTYGTGNPPAGQTATPDA